MEEIDLALPQADCSKQNATQYEGEASGTWCGGGDGGGLVLNLIHG